ncbi:MAG: hypothetical protein KDA97_07765 [Acidimicrobiales bacterium]|nr:hypothetical protein [Acidimicrobiales bacterium]
MADPAPPDVAEPEAAPVAEPVDIGGWPTWLRRSVIAVALIGAFAVAAWAATKTDDASPGDGPGLGAAVIDLFPDDGAQALRQTRIGADLAPGYDGRLTIDGVAVPEEQMEGARDPADVDPEDLAENGLRPNNRNRVYFQPGPGKVIEEFDSGLVTIELSYFKERQPDTARTVRWQIRVD